MNPICMSKHPSRNNTWCDRRPAHVGPHRSSDGFAWEVAPAVPDTRTDEDQYEEAWRAAERAVLDEREMRKKGEQERDDARAMSSLWRETTRRALRDRNSWRSVARIGDHTSATLAERVKSLRTQVQAREARAEAVERERNEAEEALVDAREEARNADQHILVEQARAVKAEQGRDEALIALDEERRTVSDLRDQLVAQEPAVIEQPRTLTAAAIEQLVTQNRYRVADAIRALYPEEPMATEVLAHTVMTALTEPQRPAWADLADTLRAIDPGEPLDIDDLAEAAHERGVRVTGEPS